jgi:hypothetical protein
MPHSGEYQVLSRPPWTDATLLNAWANLGAPFANAGYYLDELGIVHLRGVVNGGVASGVLPVFTLPAGFRPDTQILFIVYAGGGARMDISTAGDVLLVTGAGFLQLDNIHFRQGR